METDIAEQDIYITTKLFVECIAFHNGTSLSHKNMSFVHFLLLDI